MSDNNSFQPHHYSTNPIPMYRRSQINQDASFSMDMVEDEEEEDNPNAQGSTLTRNVLGTLSTEEDEEEEEEEEDDSSRIINHDDVEFEDQYSGEFDNILQGSHHVDDEEEEEEDDANPINRSAGEYMENNIAKIDEEELFTSGIRKLEHLGLVEIGNLASWSVSTYKQGYGIKELREDTPFSYWQSDGQQPHYITIHFTKKVTIDRLSFYFNYQTDESYTPSKLLVLAGTGEHDLMEVSSKDFIEPVGWQHIFFKGIRSDNLLKCYLIKICFLANHQNGKDSHVRSIKVLSPVNQSSMRLDIDNSLGVGFTSVKMLSESTVR